MAIPTFIEWMNQRHNEGMIDPTMGMTRNQKHMHRDYMDKMAMHKRMAHARHMKKMKSFMKKMGIQ